MTGEGVCPRCQQPGSSVDLCRTERCATLGYHAIPIEHYRLSRSSSLTHRDPNIGLLADEYLIVNALGRGVYGQVYLALQKPLLMPAALKLLSQNAAEPATREHFAERLRLEAMSLARLHHPNIVRLLKFGEFGESPFLAMELVAGARTLRVELAQTAENGDGMPFTVIEHIAEQIASALASAHAENVVHRDIKPDNILLQCVSGDAHFAKVVDFGLAKFVDRTRSTDFLAGTPGYMAPEQIRQKHIGAWSDVYSLGLVIIEMILGMEVFGVHSDIIAAKHDASFDPVACLEAIHLPAEVLSFLRLATAYDHTQRFQSADAFAKAMRTAFTELRSSRWERVPRSDLRALLEEAELETLEEEQRRLESRGALLEQRRRDFDAQLETEVRQRLQMIVEERKRARAEEQALAHGGAHPVIEVRPEPTGREQEPGSARAEVSSPPASSGAAIAVGPPRALRQSERSLYRSSAASSVRRKRLRYLSMGFAAVGVTSFLVTLLLLRLAPAGFAAERGATLLGGAAKADVRETIKAVSLFAIHRGVGAVVRSLKGVRLKVNGLEVGALPMSYRFRAGVRRYLLEAYGPQIQPFSRWVRFEQLRDGAFPLEVTLRLPSVVPSPGSKKTPMVPRVLRPVTTRKPGERDKKEPKRRVRTAKEGKPRADRHDEGSRFKVGAIVYARGVYAKTHWKAIVLQIQRGKYLVRYVGFGRQWDEWVTVDRMRSRSPHVARKLPVLPVGQRIYVRWRQHYYLSTILQRRGRRYLIHYVAYSDRWNEWVDPDRISLEKP